MEFKVELELIGNFTTSLITNTQGHTEIISIKTTPDRLTSLVNCIETGAKGFGYTVRDLLKNTESVKLRVPEIITDTLTNKAGDRIGLIVSQGHQENVYGVSNNHQSVLATLLTQNLVVGIEEETNPKGEQISPPRQADVQEKISYLLNLGCDIIAVSLKHASLNPANEKQLKEFARMDYPRHYLGAVPILISSDFSDEPDDAIRANICVLNAYTWSTLDQFLRRVERFLRQNGYARGLKVVQTDGEAVPITRVIPLKTCSPDQMVSLNQFTGAVVTI